MKSYRLFAASAVLAALAIAASPTYAQGPATAAEIAAPIIVHELTPKKKPSDSGSSWMKVEVIHADATTMVVSEQGNERVIHTFTYANSLKTKMQKLLDSGGYQYGDKIKILYTPGQTVALKIHGKPSKSS